MIRRLLFVSQYYSDDFGRRVSGVHQRLRLLLEAAAQAADALDILFFADAGIDTRCGADAARASLQRDCGIDATVRVAPRATMRHGPTMQTLRSLVDYRAQVPYLHLNGPVSYAAVRDSLRDDTDLIVAHRLHTGSTVRHARVGAVPVVMDLDDIEHRARARWLAGAGRGMDAWIARLELPALRRGELATLRACRTSFVCSETDRAYLAEAGVANTRVVPNAMRFDERAAVAGGAGDTLFFIGAYGHPPNAVAAEFLITAVFPLVQAVRPRSRLMVAGQDVERLPSYARSPGAVEFAGFVPDLDALYRRATVVCCPILSGGGTRIKIIEAAAACKPIVSTTIGAEGLALQDGTEILLRDTAADFARACIELLDDPARAAALGRAAFIKARSRYERSSVIERAALAFREAAR